MRHVLVGWLAIRKLTELDECLGCGLDVVVVRAVGPGEPRVVAEHPQRREVERRVAGPGMVVKVKNCRWRTRSPTR